MVVPTAGTLLVRHLEPGTVKDMLGHADLKTPSPCRLVARSSVIAAPCAHGYPARRDGYPPIA